MKIALGLVLTVGLSLPATAQIYPEPAPDNPRLQTIAYDPAQPVVITMLPETPVTVMLEPGETINSVTPGFGQDYRVRVSSEMNSFVVMPVHEAREGTLDVITAQRDYRFLLRVEDGYSAGLVVRFVDELAAPVPPNDLPDTQEPMQTWGYRMKGDNEVRPLDITDNGLRTHITYAPSQALPAVFAIGPTGKEEVVNGYMRDGLFVLDRVYDELVFRIDRDKATARRNNKPEVGE